MTHTVAERIARWNEGDGKPMKGSLIDWEAYEADPTSINCMCAQGQLLHTVGGWEPKRLLNTAQSQADKEVADLLGISRAHAVLLRNINDSADGAPSIVLTDPGKVLGGEWSKLLDFWWAFDQFDDSQWRKVVAARGAARDAARVAARGAAGDAAWFATRVASWVAAGDAAGDAAGEIQGFSVMVSRGQDVLFLPMFGWDSPAEIPSRPADYGLGIIPTGAA